MKNKIHVFSMVKFLPLSPEAKAYQKLCTTFKKLRYQLVHENYKKKCPKSTTFKNGILLPKLF